MIRIVMKKMIFAMLALLLLTSFAPQNVTTIFVIGDSTAANKNLSKGSPERGWGMALQCYFDEAFIRVENHAVNGSSSKSFIDEGRWDRVLSLIRPGDYVIIQFGHNDEKPQADRHTDPGSTFDDNLVRFINDTREKGGIPVVMNSVVRRNFSADTLVDTHGLYIEAPRNVASRMHCHFVDANRITHNLEQSLGVEGSKRLHMWYKPGEHPAIPNGRQDNTHFNAFGAHQVASLLADALTIEIPVLKKYRTNDDPCRMP